MNKKFITLCVSALLAGGMVTPAFAALNTKTTYIEEGVTDATVTNYLGFYVLKCNAGGSTTASNYSLQATENGVSYETDGNAVTKFNLWRLEPVYVNGVIDGFQLINAAGIQIGVEDDGTIKVNGENKTFCVRGNNLALRNLGLYLSDVSGQPKFTTSAGSFEANFYTPAPIVMDADALNEKFDAAFTLGIGRYVEDVYTEYTLEGNPFTGELKASDKVNLGSTGSYTFKQTLTASNNEVYLFNGDKVVVLLNEKWSNLNNSLLSDYGYKFTLMTPTELANAEAADDALIAAGKKPVIRSYVFHVAEPNSVIEMPVEVAAKVPDYVNVAMGATNADSWEELYVSEVNGTYYLTVAKAAEDLASGTNPYVSTEEGLNVADYADETHKVYVTFTQNNFVNPVTFYGKAWNIVRVADDKTLIPTGDSWVDKETVGMGVPEGQWILTYNGDGTYSWKNRETTEEEADATFGMAGLRTTDEADVYRIGDVKYKITPAVNGELGGNHDEFFGADAEESTTGIDKTYKVTFTNEVTSEPAYIGINGVGQVLLVSDPTAAIPFQVNRMKTTDNKVVVTDADVNANYDVFYIINDYMKYDAENEVWGIAKDTVSFNRYNLIYNGKYLHYDASEGYVLADPVETYDRTTRTYTNTKDAYIIKEKGDDFVNVLNTYKADYDALDANTYNYIWDLNTSNDRVRLNASKMLYTGATKDSTKMVYFDFNFAEPRHQQNIYNWVSNAQLKLDDTKSAIYRNVAPYAPDTMAIYRIEYTDEFLFEKGEFLGMTVDERGYNAALFIDTAYVRNNTEKPLFMIGLRPEFTPMSTYCPEHGFNTDCPPQHLDTIPGYVDADYLTVMADSAAANADLLQNPWLANAEYTKLAFVQARHNVDTITVAENEKKVVITEGKQDPMLFAFRYVNNETGDFIIEGVDLKNNKDPKSGYETAWIRWNNGVPVMTNQMKDAEVFNIAEVENGNPTANETITAEEGAVSVVATEGGVIVKGAEGKNVVVATILGKVVANETVNSDNETINTPAGIVVVSVDGESFKVVVK